MKSKWSYLGFGIPDNYFIRGKVPMTKEEVRAVVLGKLRLKEQQTFIDVGAGTGSVSIEAALKLKEGKVYAIEFKEEALDLIEKNKEVFEIDNLEIVKGRAKEELEKIKEFDRIFIGGSGGELEDILKHAYQYLPQEGRVVITSITVETLYKGLQLLKDIGFQEVEVINVAVSKGRFTGNYTLMEAQNSIYVLSATKRN
ncbi:MAG: precorrin-6Y C5,15-methyltransferase (decarboxylating) subunit CbiT [Clostridiaceae bacterium]|nr:precorrin-6Y C5,15-methyltransferase (decarboxylating) subunit CbiT [Clostridiaceae bacterium]